jgi:protein ImuB
VPELEAVPDDPWAERERLATLGEALLEFGPRVMLLPPDGLVVEVGGSAPLFGGEEAIARSISRRLERMGTPARVAVADGWHAARVLAEFGPRDILVVPTGRQVHEQALGPLKIEALMPAIDHHFDSADMNEDWGWNREVRLFVERFLHTFDTLGIRRVRGLAELAEGDVAERWGPAGRALHRRAKAMIEAPLVALRPAEEIREVVELEGVVGWDPLQFHLKRLLTRVVLRLQARGETALRLRLETLHHPDGLGEIHVELARGTRDPKVLHRILRERMNSESGWNESCAGTAGGSGSSEGRTGPGKGPVTQVVVVIEQAERSDGAQSDLVLAAERRGEEVVELVERLRASIGEDSVFGVVLTDRWRPEGAWAKSPTFPPPSELHSVREDGELIPPPPRWIPRPLALLPSPEPAARWGRVQSAGPVERLSGEWWEDDGGFDRSLRSAVLVTGARVWLSTSRRPQTPLAPLASEESAGVPSGSQSKTPSGTPSPIVEITGLFD